MSALILAAAVATFRWLKWAAFLPEKIMSFWLRSVAVLVVFYFAATQVWADACFHPLGLFVRRERPWDRPVPVDPEYDLVIIRDPSVKEAELRIPRQMMVADAAAPASNTRTAIAGVALSAACVAGGLWCLRYRPREIPKKKLVIGFAVIAVLFVAMTRASFTKANGPEQPNRILVPIVKVGDIAVNVRIVDQGDVVELVVTPELADKIKTR